MKNTKDNIPFDNCPALHGYHCQTNSLAMIFYYYWHPLSEEMDIVNQLGARAVGARKKPKRDPVASGDFD